MSGDFANLSPATASQWPEPHSVAVVSRGWYPAYAITLAGLATAMVTLRLFIQTWTRFCRLAFDDVLICLAWVFALLYTALSVVGTLKFGFNRHVWHVSSLERAALVQWLSEATFSVSVCLTKISVLFFYRRLDGVCTRALKGTIYGFIALTLAYTLACVLAQVLICHPITAYWSDPAHRDDHACSSQHVLYPTQGSLDAFSTVYAIAIPAFSLRTVQLSRCQRVGLRVLCSLGFVVLGISIARAVFLSRLVDSPNGDATWNGFNVFVLSQLECQLALICASLPFLQRSRPQHRAFSHDDPHRNVIERNNSTMSRVSSTVSGSLKRLSLGRSSSPRNLEISRPQPALVEIPEWEFGLFATPHGATSPADEVSYDRYVAGMYGPPVPPKDSRDLFNQYRREHGENV